MLTQRGQALAAPALASVQESHPARPAPRQSTDYRRPLILAAERGPMIMACFRRAFA